MRARPRPARVSPQRRRSGESGLARLLENDGVGPNQSLMEMLQACVPDARFVKAFSRVGSALMVKPSLPSGKPTMFFCGNDGGAKARVATIIA
jgi:predicted dinucleotide-binding enzyme